MGKKHKKKGRRDAANQGYAMPQYGAQAGAEPLGAGFLQGLPGLLGSRKSEQFLLGALLGAGAAWVLSDEELRGKLIRAAMKLYGGIAGGLEEMKEQMADIRAEVEAEQAGGE